MRFSKLAALVKNYGSATLLDERNGEEITRQHIVVGASIYPLDGFPAMDKDALLTMMDVPKDKHKEYLISRADHSERTRCYTQDFIGNEVPAEMLSMTIATANIVLNILCTADGEIVFLNNAYRKVVSDEKSVEWWLRKLDSGMVVVATRGYQFIGCATVERNWVDDKVVDILSDVATVAAHMNEAKKDEAKKRDGEQQHM